VNGVVLGRDPHHFASTPGNGADIGIRELHALKGFFLGPVDLLCRPGNFKPERMRGIQQPFGVLFGFEYPAAISPFAFKHAAAVMQSVAQNMKLCI